MKRNLVIFIVVLLLIITCGGFFIYEYWWAPGQQNINEPEQIKTLIKKKGQEVETKEETLKGEEKLTTEQLFTKSQELIIEAQELIEKTEEFIKEQEKEKQLALEKAIQEAYQNSSNVKGVYMTEFIANSQNPAAVRIREDIKKLLDETELNSVVIDVKEAYGPDMPSSLKKLIEELHQARPDGQPIWVIARIVVFRDSSLMDKQPELYIKTKDGDFWQDDGGGFWLDPASPEVQNYIIEFSKKVIDFGFDELQFDYIRFPSDGDLKDIVYPTYNQEEQKYEIISKFLLNLFNSLKSYQPSTILSVDFFGYTASQFNAFDIGQRLKDVAIFDYISFMLYPSHFYGGLIISEDLKRGLPAISFPYTAEDINEVVSNHPYEVVLRSIFSASDCLNSLNSKAKIRPWLQDFNLKFDTDRGIYYDAEKIRAQIKATEDAGASGWLLWSSSNIYTKEALNP